MVSSSRDEARPCTKSTLLWYSIQLPAAFAIHKAAIRLGRPRVSIECKDAGTNGSVDEMRAFVARLYDLSILYAHHRYLGVVDPPMAIHPDAPSGSIHRAARTYWIENRRTLNVLARRTGFTMGAAALTGYHAVEPHAGITVGSSSAKQLMNDVADWIYGRGY